MFAAVVRTLGTTRPLIFEPHRITSPQRTFHLEGTRFRKPTKGICGVVRCAVWWPDRSSEMRDALTEIETSYGNVCFWTKADKVGFWPAMVCPLMTQLRHWLCPRAVLLVLVG